MEELIKKVSYSSSIFSHERSNVSVRLITAKDPDILILEVKEGKVTVTTSISKGDISILSEFFKQKGLM